MAAGANRTVCETAEIIDSKLPSSTSSNYTSANYNETQYYCTSEGCGYYQYEVCLDCDEDGDGFPDESFDPRNLSFEGCDDPGLVCSDEPGFQIAQGEILHPSFALNATGFSASEIPSYENYTYGYINQTSYGYSNGTVVAGQQTSFFSPFVQEQIAKGNVTETPSGAILLGGMYISGDRYIDVEKPTGSVESCIDNNTNLVCDTLEPIAPPSCRYDGVWSSSPVQNVTRPMVFTNGSSNNSVQQTNSSNLYHQRTPNKLVLTGLRYV